METFVSPLLQPAGPLLLASSPPCSSASRNKAPRGMLRLERSNRKAEGASNIRLSSCDIHVFGHLAFTCSSQGSALQLAGYILERMR